MTDILNHETNPQFKAFICEQCQRSFKKQNKLFRHVNETHLNMKDFSCTICEKCFKRKSHLKRHMIIHSSEPKPFRCLFNDCLMRFSDKYHLERHIKVKHKNIKLECIECSLFFEKKLFLLKHNFQSHNIEKPFKCLYSLCARSFYSKGTLDKHIKHHEFAMKRKKNTNILQNNTLFIQDQSHNLIYEGLKEEIACIDAMIDNNIDGFPQKDEVKIDSNCYLSPIDEEYKEINEFVKKEIEFNKNDCFNKKQILQEFELKEDNSKEKTIKYKENKENLTKTKSKLKEHSNFLLTCMEPNCGKTYSTVKNKRKFVIN